MLRRSALAVVLCSITILTVHAQWQIQDSHSTASLRGVSSPGNGVAWASGTGGTVLRTEDGGYMWQSCAMPPGAEKLDFRGIQAFDANTAIVMSSGKGDLSRIYKTTDGCSSWKLVATNPDTDGFWDALSAPDPKTLLILGDPVNGHFVIRTSTDLGATWSSDKNEETVPARPGEGAFAASNSSMAVYWIYAPAHFITGSPQGARVFTRGGSAQHPQWTAADLPMFAKGEAAGAFSISYANEKHWVAVGGDYTKPEAAAGSAAWSDDGGKTWHAPSSLPHGYRSAVAYDKASKTWITVGPNGTDISRDDGRTWVPLKPASNEPSDADKNWNALALPYVVGPKGRIGKLNPSAPKP